MERAGDQLRRGIADHVESAGLKAEVNGVGSMFQIFFTDHPVTDYHSAKTSDTVRYQRYFHSLLASRVFVPPSQFETCFLATCHVDDEMEATVEAIGSALRHLAG